VVGLRYQFIYQRGRKLSVANVLLYRSPWGFYQHKFRAPQLNLRGAAERLSCKSRETCLESIGLIVHSSSERLRPVPLNEIMAVIKQQQSSVIEVAARPRRHMEGGPQPVAGLKSGKEALLKVNDSGKPQLGEQRIA
jgi:hypothetical protein